jgi:hypothetical protein
MAASIDDRQFSVWHGSHNAKRPVPDRLLMMADDHAPSGGAKQAVGCSRHDELSWNCVRYEIKNAEVRQRRQRPSHRPTDAPVALFKMARAPLSAGKRNRHG